MQAIHRVYNPINRQRWGFFILLWLPLGLFAQKQEFQFGAGVSTFLYHGDIKDNNPKFYPGMNFFFQLNPNRLISQQLNIGTGKFSAQNTDASQFVQTPFYYFNLQLKLQPWREYKLRPYGGAGVGLLNFKPRDRNGNSLVDQGSTRETGETYSGSTFLLPLNLGVSYQLNPWIRLNLDYNRFVVATDYLDNIGNKGTRSGNDALRSLLFSVVVFIAK